MHGWGKKEDFTQLLKQAEEVEAMIAACGNQLQLMNNSLMNSSILETVKRRKACGEFWKKWKLRRLSWKIRGYPNLWVNDLNSWIVEFCRTFSLDSLDFLKLAKFLRSSLAASWDRWTSCGSGFGTSVSPKWLLAWSTSSKAMENLLHQRPGRGLDTNRVAKWGVLEDLEVYWKSQLGAQLEVVNSSPIQMTLVLQRLDISSPRVRWTKWRVFWPRMVTNEYDRIWIGLNRYDSFL